MSNPGDLSAGCYVATSTVDSARRNLFYMALPIPTKPPLHSEMIAPPDSDLMSPPLGRGLAGYDCCRFGHLPCQAFRCWFRRMLSPVRSMRWALWTSLSRMASA